MSETWIRSLIWEDPTCHGATKPVCDNYWACALEPGSCIYWSLHTLEIWKTQQWPQDWKRSVFIPLPKKGNAKECSNYRTIALISHTSKLMLTILQARLQQYVNFPMFKLDLEKAEDPEIKLPTSVGKTLKKKQESSRKKIYFCFNDYAKAFHCVDHNKLWKNSERDGNT